MSKKALTPLWLPLSVLLWLGLVTVAWAGTYRVVWVPDGDTIKVQRGNRALFVRLVGIDAPEKAKAKGQPGQPYSRKAARHLAALVLNKTVEIRSYGKDRYDRVLGLVSVDGNNVNLEMLRAGLAEVYRGRTPLWLDMRPFRSAQDEARQKGRGIWSLGDRYVSPRDWKKNHPWQP